MQQLVLKVLCSTLLLLAVVPSVFSQPDCSQASSCDQCIGDSELKLEGCVWRICPYPYGNDTGMCLTDGGEPDTTSVNCTWIRVPEMCADSASVSVSIVVVETVVETEGGGESDSGPGDGSQTNSSPDFSQAKFDMSSFIGGIILVLCLQGAGFFAMRYLKSKEQSNYDPIEQPQ